jgi:hypothetical protein
MHKINPGVKRAEFERDKRRERERTQKKHEKGRKKETIFFLIDWGPSSRKKEKNLKAMSRNKKATKQGRRKKKLNKTVGGAMAPPTTNVAPPLKARVSRIKPNYYAHLP